MPTNWGDKLREQAKEADELNQLERAQHLRTEAVRIDNEIPPEDVPTDRPVHVAEIVKKVLNEFGMQHVLDKPI
jgi:hypothetical protein